jgi:hypothetical protein
MLSFTVGLDSIPESNTTTHKFGACCETACQPAPSRERVSTTLAWYPPRYPARFRPAPFRATR